MLLGELAVDGTAFSLMVKRVGRTGSCLRRLVRARFTVIIFCSIVVGGCRMLASRARQHHGGWFTGYCLRRREYPAYLAYLARGGPDLLGVN